MTDETTHCPCFVCGTNVITSPSCRVCDVKCVPCTTAQLESFKAKYEELRGPLRWVDIVFDGPPGPEAGSFIDVEDVSGASVSVGEWRDRGDGTWALRMKTT